MTLTLKECKCTPNQIELAHRYHLLSSDDVLVCYPFRYEEIVEKPKVEWQLKEKVCIEGTIATYPNTVRFGKNRSMTKFQLETDEDYFDLVLFNRPWINNLKVGGRLTVIGRYEGQNKITVMQYNTKPLKEQLGIVSVYPLKEGVQQRTIQSLVKKVFIAAQATLQDFIPSDFILSYKLMSRRLALRCVHFPRSMEEVHLAYRTLKYEEFLKFHLAVLGIRNQEKAAVYTEGKTFDAQIIYNMMDELPFECTEDQKNAIVEILKDMQSHQIMYRLVQGDVGCGKTVVAWMAMVACVLAKKQAAMMAPTEILAKQHYESCLALAQGTSIKIAVLYSAMSTASKKEVIAKLKNHEIDICIGTHALIQDTVEFADLGLVVADEQHRFGVEQRRKLKEKGDKVDFLLMSATPIPRTLANTLYGDMDISSILTMPAGRKTVLTKLIEKNSIQSILSELKQKLKQKEQIYVICAAIEESENFEARNVLDITEELRKKFGSIANVGVLHGRMSSDEKDAVMNDFEANKIQILVSTTVVEVGVNVVNATTMVIYDAHRFGLSSLHQLRGRVQRGIKQGACYLLTDSKEPESLKRLQILVECHDGFTISMEDLKLRGPGDILGVRQSGLPGFILGNLVEDTRIIETARNDAKTILEHPENPEYLRCIDIIRKLNQEAVNYMD